VNFNQTIFPGLAEMSGLASLQSNQSFVSLMASQAQGSSGSTSATLGGYGKIMHVNGSGAHVAGGGGLPILTSYRYAPYQLPSAMATNQAVAQQAQVAALVAQQQYQVSQARQDQSTSPQHHVHSQSVGQTGLSHTSLNLAGANGTMPSMAQANHLSTVLPTVSMGTTGSLSTPAVATQANNLAVAAAAKYATTVSAPSINPHPFQGYNIANVEVSNFQVTLLTQMIPNKLN
jgi:hypothetical protein